jgi:arylsulfatase A-like enzyme
MVTNKTTRRKFLTQLGYGAAFFWGQRSLRGRNRVRNFPRAKPNIILIMADDLGYGDIGCYGNKTIKTPSLDALATGGMKFTDFHSNGAVCSPTRAALLTGRYQQRSGIEGVVYAKGPIRETGMPLKETTFAEVLKSAGYKTALFGKWHLGYNVKFNPTKQGFDAFRGYVSGNVDYHSHIDGVGVEDWWHNDEKVPEEGYCTDLITKHAVRFMEANRNRPFCLYVPHECPHYPYQGRKDKADRIPGNPEPMLGSRENRAKAYQEMIEAMDEGIGEIVRTVRRLNLERTTFIFFCSDNGATGPGSNGSLRAKKGSLYEGGHRVPALAYWPGKIQAGSVTHETSLTMDLFPTMTAITGTNIPGELKLDGVDLSPVLFKGKSLPERTLFWRYRRQSALRRGPWKLVVNRPRQEKKQPNIELFNLAEDRSESNSRKDEFPDKTRALMSELTRWEENVTAGVKMRA